MGAWGKYIVSGGFGHQTLQCKTPGATAGRFGFDFNRLLEFTWVD